MNLIKLITDAWQITSANPLRRFAGAFVLAASILMIGAAIVIVWILVNQAPDSKILPENHVIEYYPDQSDETK